MKKFKVISSKGFNLGGKQYAEGETLSACNKSAHVQTGLHFNQIEPAEEPTEPSEKAPADLPPEPARRGRPPAASLI